MTKIEEKEKIKRPNSEGREFAKEMEKRNRNLQIRRWLKLAKLND